MTINVRLAQQVLDYIDTGGHHDQNRWNACIAGITLSVVGELDELDLTAGDIGETISDRARILLGLDVGQAMALFGEMDEDAATALLDEMVGDVIGQGW